MALRSISPTMPSQMLSRIFISSETLGRASRILWSSPSVFNTLSKPAALSLNIPGLLSDVWDSVLQAVPKKKTSHMKKRHRQMAGKALKDVKNLNTCSGCGQIKRAHVLCPHCVENIKKQWKQTHTA
ncbi:hypothetical protein BDV23DRAFT_148206 [Aspergillus alliaceus]|uniref:Large ribosomal subunit protein bL32m n=1 Tax=Petromyces alliaceus TaxID=209559 RepID=A0A5N7CJR6_PETAA|nr:hypothetical protein BDV23DRAFT_148206 [Aspergillus alliaceus]